MKRGWMLVGLVGLLGCEPLEAEVFLGALTTAPPGLTGSVQNPFEEEVPPSIQLSLGVGLGIGCSEQCPDRSFSVPDCIGASYTAEPPGLLQIHPVSLDSREGVILAVADEVGSGTLRVRTQCADKEYQLRVIE